jgi:hypothetical protein
MKDLKLYKNAKELPFLTYKKIMQTGDFLYMIKGYEEGDEAEADPKGLEIKFNELIQEFSIHSGEFTQQMHDHANYMIATIEYNRLTTILNIMDVIIRLEEQGVSEEEDVKHIADLLEGIVIERNPDFQIQRQKIIEKAAIHESNILKYKEIQEKGDSTEDNQEYDIDDQFLNVFMILEQPFPDESKLTLYQYSLMVKKAVEKAKSFEKLNQK